ncbi:transaldolase [Streptomyces sp. Ru71]|uniref:transaldolase n=1 Tax=Streptomyces sp. Ru71 TaxID=2080746 RepID=UPI000CDDC569|nr:transaldolase [Streptomyces sp. Ru71]POX56977.1 transaldolase [Streptomyces sp. Ru71]
MTHTPIERLRQAGVSLWLDHLSRASLDDGSLADVVADGQVVGITSNPTILAQALAGASEAYAPHLNVLARKRLPAADALRELATYDVRHAADLLLPVHRATGGRDGYVSLEVDPAHAHDADATLAEARLLWSEVDRPNLMVKIPATPEGLRATTAALAEGINVNVTLIFSQRRYDDVVEAFLSGVEQAHRSGRDLSRIASVASFFVSRIDTAVDRELDRAGSDEARALRGRAAVANARLAYWRWERSVAGPRWRRLAELGARPQRLLWASTGVKDPSYEDTRYVDELAAPDTVNTVPPATLRAVADHGRADGRNRITGRYDDARRVLGALPCFGIDFDTLTERLADDALAAFMDSWQQMADQVDGTLAARRELREAA